MAANDSRPRTSLYVGDLHPEVTEKDLVETFGQVGPLLSVNLCCEKHSRKSPCYAYVNFWFHCHASTALKSLNHTTLRGKSMRIMWSQRDGPITKKNNIGNLFVKNLHNSITSSRLQEVFSKYGTLLYCKVVERKGVSRGFGFVQFDSEDSAMAACYALHDSFLEGKKLIIERKDSEPGFRSLYIKNLDEGITEDVLKDKFSEQGKVTRAVIMKNGKGKSNGFGFVHFDSHEAAQKAMEVLNGELIGSKKIFVGRVRRKATNPSKDSKASKLYVKNLNASVDDKKLEELFSSYGKVTSAKVIRNRDGVSRGYGFVCFSCPQEANNALHSLIGAEFEGKTLYLAFSSLPKAQQTRDFEKFNAKIPTQPIQWRPLYPNSAFIPLRSIMLWNTVDCVKQHYPVQHGTWDVYIPDKCAEIRKGQVPSNVSPNKAINGDEKESCKWSPAEIDKIWPVHMYQPLVHYLQPVYVASGNGLPLGITQKFLNSPRSILGSTH